MVTGLLKVYVLARKAPPLKTRLEVLPRSARKGATSVPPARVVGPV